MAISFSNGTVQATGTTEFTLTPTVPSGAEIFACFHVVDDGGSTKSFNGALYDLNAMTERSNLDPSYPMHGAWTYDVTGLTLPDSPTVESDLNLTDNGIFSGVSILGSSVTIASVHEDGNNAASTTATTTVTTQAGDVLLISLGWDGAEVDSGITKSTGQTLITGTDGNSSMFGGLYQQTASGTSTTVTFTQSGTQEWSMIVLVLREAGASRSITNIDGDDNVQAGQTNVTITTVGLDASPATQTATLGGESLTVNSWSATAVNVDIPLHIDLEWGSTTNQLALTDDTGTVTLNNVTLSAPTGWETVTYNGTAPNPATTESFYEYAQTDVEVGSFTMATNDILAWETQTGLTVDVQTIPIVDPPVTVSGAYKIWDDSLSTWTSVSSFTITDGGTFGGGSVPADSRKSVFKIAAYLRSTGTYTAKQTNELVVEWLVDEGTTRSNLNDMLYTYLGTLGLTGTLDDRLSKWQDL
jgi:hypothetical protein